MLNSIKYLHLLQQTAQKLKMAGKMQKTQKNAGIQIGEKKQGMVLASLVQNGYGEPLERCWEATLQVDYPRDLHPVRLVSRKGPCIATTEYACNLARIH